PSTTTSPRVLLKWAGTGNARVAACFLKSQFGAVVRSFQKIENRKEKKKMQAVAKLSKNLTRPLFFLAPRTLTALAAPSLSNLLTSLGCDTSITHCTNTCLTGRTLLQSPWSAIQHRGAVVLGSDVIKVEHSHEGRGKAHIKVELRDVDSGNKTSQRLSTDEAVERVFVETKSYIYMCTDRDGIVLLMDPDTYDQLEVPEDLFGKKAKYLQEELKVKVELFNGIPLSASVPKHVTCIVKEAQPPVKGIAATPKDKIAEMQNGFTMKVPPHIIAGEAVIIDTEDDSYVRRAKA
ncbi:elongation factor P family protein, partial [Prunus dulcis]